MLATLGSTRARRDSLPIIDPGNPLCNESGNRFRPKSESVAGRLSPRSLVFATQTSFGTSISLDSQGDED